MNNLSNLTSIIALFAAVNISAKPIINYDFVTTAVWLASFYLISHVKWVLCHHGLARLQVADGGGGLQIWMVAANIFNKQLRTADKR
jgi:hypothetical protein